jgi:gliding-associated putative ABC transporter substrate-binding component GldG
MQRKSALYLSVALIVGILILANLLSSDYFLRLDFTEDQRYTLSKATEDILDELAEPVTVTAYFSEDLPPDIARTKSDFRDMLVEYANNSDNMVVYEFVNPNDDPEIEQEAMQNGISPVLVNVRDQDEISQKRAFLGAVIQMGEEQEVIPFVQPGAAMEYTLSTNIKKISAVDKPSIGILQGHGEPSINALPQVANELFVLYSPEDLTLTDTADIPTKFKTIAILAPTDSIPDSHLAQLDAFLARGGNILLAFDRVEGDLQNSYGRVINTGLESWLADKGVQVEENFVIDANCGAVTVQQQQGFFTMNTQVSFPYLPIVSNFAEHPISAGLEAVIMPFVSSLAYTGSQDSSNTVKFTPLATSSAQSGTVPAPTYFDINKQWTENDFPLEALPIAAALEGTIEGSTEAKMVVIADGGFATQGGPQGGDNVSLLVNSIDWLSDDTGLIELRTKGVTSRPLEQVEDATKSLIKYANFLIPILLVVGYGVVRFQMKRNVRQKRMQESYA